MNVKTKQRGSFKRLEKWFINKSELAQLIELDKYGQRGLLALERATPVDTGVTAKSWRYRIELVDLGKTYKLSWYNINVQNGLNIALLIQYGHGLKDGGYVPAFDYINPAIKPIYEALKQELWEEVKRH